MSEIQTISQNAISVQCYDLKKKAGNMQLISKRARNPICMNYRRCICIEAYSVNQFEVLHSIQCFCVYFSINFPFKTENIQTVAKHQIDYIVNIMS